MHFTLRISLPDRPGTLGQVATAFGKGGANILTLDVVESDSGQAVDDLVVDAPEGMQDALRRAIEEVPGLVVEELRPLKAFPDLLSPLELAAFLVESGANAVQVLVDRLPEALRSDWSVVLSGGPGGVRILGSSMGSPSLAGVELPWLPIDRPIRLPPAGWMPPSWVIGPASREGQGKFELAAAPLFDSSSAVLVGRRKGPQYRTSELVALQLLTRIAAAAASKVPASPAS